MKRKLLSAYSALTSNVIDRESVNLINATSYKNNIVDHLGDKLVIVANILSHGPGNNRRHHQKAIGLYLPDGSNTNDHIKVRVDLAEELGGFSDSFCIIYGAKCLFGLEI